MRKLLIIFAILPLFITGCYAQSVLDDSAKSLDIKPLEEALDEREREISGTLTLDGSYDSQGAIARMLQSLYEGLLAELKINLRDVAAIVEIAFICSLCAAFCQEKKYAELMSIIGCCIVALGCVKGADSVISQACNALARLSDYSKAAMPVLFTAAAAAGAVASASARYAAICISVDLFINAAQRFVIPCIYAFLVLSISKSFFSNHIITACAGCLRWAACTLMSLMTVAFSAYISISGMIAGSTDAVAVKTARTVISSALPVVGGIISDSASVILSAASVIKNSVGVFGLISVCALCVEPFAILGVKLFMYKAAGVLTEMASCERLSALVKDIGKAVGMLLGLVGSCGIMLFISFMSAIKVGI